MNPQEFSTVASSYLNFMGNDLSDTEINNISDHIPDLIPANADRVLEAVKNQCVLTTIPKYLDINVKK